MFALGIHLSASERHLHELLRARDGIAALAMASPVRGGSTALAELQRSTGLAEAALGSIQKLQQQHTRVVHLLDRWGAN